MVPLSSFRHALSVRILRSGRRFASRGYAQRQFSDWGFRQTPTEPRKIRAYSIIYRPMDLQLYLPASTDETRRIRRRCPEERSANAPCAFSGPFALPTQSLWAPLVFLWCSFESVYSGCSALNTGSLPAL